MEKKYYHLSIVTVNPMLGTQPGNKTPASDFIRDKTKEERPDLDISDEIGTLPEELQKGTTGFYRLEGKPCLYNYHIKGMLKDAALALGAVKGIKNLRSKIDNLVFVSPRQLPIATDQPITILERPLRAMTMQGMRVSLARSEMIEAGAKVECDIEIIETEKTNINEEVLRELFDYATRKGIGQWRNSGAYGQFTYTLTVK